MSGKNKERFSAKRASDSRKRGRAERELLSVIEKMGVGHDTMKFIYTDDGGRGKRRTDKIMRGERVAKGVFSSSKSGFGFVTVEGLERDVFIPEGNTKNAIDADTVEVIFREYRTRFGENKTEGRVRKILSYGRKTVIGTVTEDSALYRAHKNKRSYYYVIPDDAKLGIRPIIPRESGVMPKDKVEVRLDRDGDSLYLKATVVRNFGRAESREANYEAILSESGITVDFTKEELAEAEFFASLPISDENRVRLERDVIFTIDGADAKDLDDAVSLKKVKGGGWQLGVHIADVSYYVREKTHLDRAAMARGTSVYFTDKVVPMLPPSLSNGACSLNAGEEKYALSAIISLTAKGEISALKLLPTVIKSRVRGVYGEVNKIFDSTADGELRSKYKEVIPTLNKMRELYEILKAKSESRGALELDGSEAEIILSPSGEPVDVVKRERGIAERIIEQFMLTANEAVARRLSEENIPCVYRIHEKPPIDKMNDFLLYMHNLGFDTSVVSKDKASPSDFSRLLRLASERGLSQPVSYSMLRAMSKAKYSETRSEHFGLSLDYYCHFTSPIRRLSDLATHRIIHKTLFEGKRPEIYTGYAKRAAAAATDGELRALSAERRIENLYKVIYMERYIGKGFSARVSSITSFGMFCELENTIEGLVPISEMPGVFVFDEKNITLRSRDRIYSLGDEVTVVLEEADRIRGKLRFSIADEDVI